MNPLNAIPTLTVVWAVVTLCFFLLIAYRGQITRYEEDQLFLNGGESNEQREQTEIVKKLNRLAPFVRLLGGAATLATVCIAALWIYDAWQHIK